MASGMDDSQFVEITGTVRSVQQLQDASQLYMIEIATGSGRLTVYARQLPVAQAESMVDSDVRARGVCSTKFNHQRQLFAVRLMVPQVEDLVVESPAPEDPFAVTARTIGSLLQFNPLETYGHRIKVSGTVIYFEAGRKMCFRMATTVSRCRHRGTILWLWATMLKRWDSSAREITRLPCRTPFTAKFPTVSRSSRHG